MGTPAHRFPDSTIPVGQSVFVSILPQLDQLVLYNGVNFSRNIYTYANQTVHQAGLSVLLCPSDGTVAQKETYPDSYQDLPAGAFVIAYSSYGANSGTWYHMSGDFKLLATLSQGDNGVAFANSSVGFGDITDGTSHTLLFGERAHGRLDDYLRLRWHWWFDGYYGDTLFWTLYPINADITPPEGLSVPDEILPAITSAGSFHPGGANFAFADGSVRFLAETIDSWPQDPARMLPVDVTGGPGIPYVLSHGVRPGVYQALSTRNGGEVIGDPSVGNR